MSEWLFRSSKNNNSYQSKKNILHKNDENLGFNANRMGQMNESVCHRNSNKISSYNDDPFVSRPKIRRTPLILSETNLNNLNKYDYNNRILGQSPIIPYFIPNTPMIGVNNKDNKENEEKEERFELEPGSTGILNKHRRKRRRSSGISVSSQPEGIYSPIPKSKILNEYNQNINRMDVDISQIAQSPVSILNKQYNLEQKDEEKEKEIKIGNQCWSISSEKKRSIRNEVRAELERMEKEINDDYKLINPSPSILLSRMRKLKISNSPYINKQNLENNLIKNDVDTVHQKEYIDNNENKKNFVFRIFMKCCNGEIWLNLLNFVFILIVLVLYWNVVQFQWK